MTAPSEELFTIGISSSALFDTRESQQIYDQQGEDAFIEHQKTNEQVPFGPGPAMPLVRAMLAANGVCGKQRIAVTVLSHTNPMAITRTVKSMRQYGIPIRSASFVRDSDLAPYCKAHQVSVFLSRNASDVRAAIKEGIPAAHLPGDLPPGDFIQTQLRIAFDCDSVLFSDESERIGRVDLPAFYKNELEKEHIPMPPGPFAPVLRFISRLQQEARAAGGKYDVRIAIVTARNEDAIARVIRTFEQWGVRIDEASFLGPLKKTEFLEAFRPHMFFDDQGKHVEPASKVVPAGHVIYGVANEQSIPSVTTALPEETAPVLMVAEYTSSIASTPSSIAVTSTTSADPNLTTISKKDFEVRARAVLSSYTPLGQRARGLDPRFRAFMNEHAGRTGVERAKILAALERYSLADLKDHDPLLNREAGTGRVEQKLGKIATEALAPKQTNLNLK